jgi:hypothetical protein
MFEVKRILVSGIVAAARSRIHHGQPCRQKATAVFLLVIPDAQALVEVPTI